MPYNYISTQDVAKDANLNAKYDVIVFPPVGRGAEGDRQRHADVGQPAAVEEDAGDAEPRHPRIRPTTCGPGLGWTGVAHLQDFVRKGGLLLTVMDTADLAVSTGFTPGLSVAAAPAPAHRRQRRALEDGRRDEPDRVRLHRQPRALVRQRADLQRLEHVRRPRRPPPRPDDGGNRPTGRGTADDPDVPQGRAGVEVAARSRRSTRGRRVPVTDEQLRNGINVIPPAARPRVVLRYADTRDLLVSGLVENGGEIAQHAAVVDVPLDKGHVVAFSNNPIWRGETRGQLLPGVQRAAELRPSGRGQEAGSEIGRDRLDGRDGTGSLPALPACPAPPAV